jgi:diguanylate cyclase (GGDEF)-like protein
VPYGVARSLGESTADAAFSALIEAISEAAAVLDVNGAVAFVNNRFAALVDSNNEQLTGRPFAGVLPLIEQSQLTLEVGFESLSPGVSPGVAPGASSGAVLVRVREVGAEPVAKGELDLAERRYRQLALSAGDLVTLHAPDRSLLGWWSNGTFPADAPASIGEQLEVLTHPDDTETLSKAWTAAAETDDSVTVSYRIERTPGVWAWVESKIQAVRDAAGDLVELQTVSRDITEQRSFQHELARLALRDPLTGLANRLLFGDRLRAAVARLNRGRGPIAVLLLDVDRFKGVNDSLGHTTGDRLLVELGARLSVSVRASDTVARLSGDEFAVLAEDLDSAEAANALAERTLAALQLPYELEGGFTLTVTPASASP